MNKFKIGDKVICVGGFVNNDNDINGGGYGYKEGRILTLYKIFNYNNFGGIHKNEAIVFGYDEYGDSCGVWTNAIVKLPTLKPIKYIKKLHMV